MFEKLKHIYVRRLIKKLSLRPRTKRLSCYDDMKSVLLLVVMHDASSWDAITEVSQLLESDGKQVEIIAYLPADFKREFLITRTHTTLIYEAENLNFWRLPNHDILQTPLAQHYDLLIDATGSPNSIAQYITLSSDAAWRIAYEDRSMTELPSDAQFRNTELYDCVISDDHPMQMLQFIKNIIDYIKILKANH